MSQNRSIVIAGGSGFLGHLLCASLVADGYRVVVLSRCPARRQSDVTCIPWDGRVLGEWTRCLDGAEALINLAGRSVNCRYHRRNRRAILESRLQSTRLLGEAVGSCAAAPRVWLNSSTATIYKHSLEQPMDELSGEIASTPEAKDAFSVDVAVAWERAFEQASTPATRKVALRTAIVLDRCKGTALDVLGRLVRWRLGGTMAPGNQFFSWIHGRDFCRAIRFLLDRDDLSGPVNLAAPNPVSNRELMRALRQVCGVRIGLPATRWMLELGALPLRSETELMIKSRRVVPTRLLQKGFHFHFPELEAALSDILGRYERRR